MQPLRHAHEDLLALLEGASRHVDILSPALEPHLFDHDDVVAAITRLVRRGRQSRVRILISGLEPVQFEAHKLMALARRLTSAVSVKVLDSHPEWSGETAVLVDGCEALILQPSTKQVRRLEGRADVQRWQGCFDRLWIAAHESPELRQFH